MHPQHENPRSFPVKPYGASSRNRATFWVGAPDASQEEAPWIFIHSETFHGKCATFQ
jgi:hypothetical protein